MQWWLTVVKSSFINAGVVDSPSLDATSWHLIKLYSTLQGWEIIPGIYNICSLWMLLFFLKSNCHVFVCRSGKSASVIKGERSKDWCHFQYGSKALWYSSGSWITTLL